MFIRLKPGFREERKREREKQKQGQSGVYLSDQGRAKYELLVLSSGWCDQARQLLDGNYLYVRTLDGKVYLSKKGEISHHSFLSNGKKVTSAGHFIFEKGKLLVVSNESGHYTPTNSEMQDDVKFYSQLSQNTDLIYEDHSSVPTQGKIYQFKANDFIAKEGDVQSLMPIEIIDDTLRENDQRSVFGKQLKKQPVEVEHDSVYLDDEVVNDGETVGDLARIGDDKMSKEMVETDYLDSDVTRENQPVYNGKFNIFKPCKSDDWNDLDDYTENKNNDARHDNFSIPVMEMESSDSKKRFC